MGDFHQHGVVTTLHQLNQRPTEQLEADLMQFGKSRPMALILPSLYSELQGPALSLIVDELCEVTYLEQIVVGLDRATKDEYQHALEFFSRLPQRPQVLWNDGPRLRKIDKKLREHNLAPEEPGKGRNVWYMFGYILATNRATAVALHDCDITTYKRDMLARLIYPIANPSFSYKFCKGYYARVADNKMNGRVCRLLVTPLVRALKMVCGHHHYLEFLDSFRYPLAGEFALQRDVIEDLNIPSDWGLEMGVLSEMHRNYATNQICQVDVADHYDHKHQDLSAEDRSRGLSKMSGDIAKSLFRKMATQGVVFSSGVIRTIKAAYYRIALDLVESHNSDAIINGLRYDRHSEGLAVELFAENIMLAGQDFLDKSMDTPFLPSWKRVISAFPEVMHELIEAVNADTLEFGTTCVVNPALHPLALRLRHRVSQHLEALYGVERAEELTDRLLHESGLEGQTQTAATHHSKWTQDDVIVVTYGNSITCDDEPPLRTIHRFLNRELKGTVSSVHILPFFPYSSDDGFSVIDYGAVNPELGTWEDIEAISENFCLMADLVLNHCSRESDWFKNYLRGVDPGSGYFIETPPDADVSDVVRPRSTPLLTPVETSSGTKHVWCTFSPDQVDLNFANPEVLFEFVRILRDLVKHGVRYFRLDAVAYLWKELGTNCVHLPQTHEVIKLVRLVLEHLDERSVVITETNVPNRENLSYFGNDNEAHLIYNFSLPPLLLHALVSGNCRHLKTWMMSMPPARTGQAYLNFIASHDGIGVRPTEGLLSDDEVDGLLATMQDFGGKVSYRRMPTGEEKPYEINISLYDAFRGTIQSGADSFQFQRFLCAHTIVLALEGLPAVYIHSLLGTENDLERREQTGSARAVNRHQWNLDDLTNAFDDESTHHRRLFEELKRRIRVRRGQLAFHPNATQFTLHLGDGIFAFWRESLCRAQCVFAVHNVTDQPQTTPLVELNLIATEVWRDLLTGTIYEDLEESIELEPYGCIWISNK